MRQTDNWLKSYLRLVRDTEPSQLFHLWTATTIVGAMLGRKCEVKFGPEVFFPNLYTVLIGPPGVRKGTAIKYGVNQILNEVHNATDAPDAVTKEQLIGEFQSVQQTENVNGNPFVHSTLFVIAPELVVFIKENDHERLGYLCQLYDGLPKFEYKTKTSQNFYVVNPGLWILGATTPNWIEIAMKQLGVGGGMTSRTVFIYAGKKGKHISASKLKPLDPILKSKLITDLGEIRKMAGRFRFTPDADRLYTEWYEGDPRDNAPRYLRKTIDDSRFDSYWERLPSMVIKVAMIVSASCREDYTIIPEDIVRSIQMFEAIHPEMPLAFGALGQNVLGSKTEMVRALLRERGKAYKYEILQALRMHLSEWDYCNVRNGLISERFCRRDYDDEGGELLTCVEETKRSSSVHSEPI